jgi:lipopolysaccharide export LptBFGC system permease protein LptF
MARFDRYWLQIDVGQFFSSAKPKDPSEQELTLPELREKIREQAGKGEAARKLLLNYHERFALPFGTLVFCTLGIPLSLLSQRSVRYTGFTLSIGVVLLYYVFLQLGTGLILAGRIPVVLGAWLPNLLLGSLGFYLLWKKAGERPTRILDGYADVAERFVDRLKQWTHRT